MVDFVAVFGNFIFLKKENPILDTDMDKGFHRVTAGELLNKVQIA